MEITNFGTHDVLSEKHSYTIRWQFLKRHGELIAALISGLLIALGFLFPAYAVYFFLSAFTIGGFAKAKEGFVDLFVNKTLNVEILMVLAAIGSAIIGFWAEGAILIFIFALSGALETYTLNKSERELSSLMEMQPDEATLITAAGERIVSASTLKIGDTILIKPGERIPADGKIIRGQSSVNEAAITGESIPANKQMNSEVFTGTVNISGALTVTVTKDQQDTLFQRIINIVQSAKNEKSTSQLFIDRFEGTYVKIVLVIFALMLFLPYYTFGWSWQETWYRAMVLLVVASPCAVVASIMPATLASIANTAKQGILFKGGNHLETIASLKAIAFDKTGTITNGIPEVTDILVRTGLDENDFLQAVGSIEKLSNHPLAKAIVRFAKEKNVTLLPVHNTEDIAGRGILASINNIEWKIGKAAFIGEEQANEFHKETVQQFEQQGKTVIFVEDNESVAGIIALRDTVRKEALIAVNQLKKAGIHTIMITGDGKRAAHSIASETGIDEYRADTLPEEKLEEIKQLKRRYGKVAMIGDGINDSPALATANIGVAMGEGTDIALETADVILMKNNLLKVPETIALSKKMNRIVKQNIIFSIAVILLLIASNFFQMIDLPFGVIGHEGSTLLVILNGLRMLKG